MNRPIYTPKQIAERFQVSVQMVRYYLRTGKLKGFKIGKHWRVDEKSLRDMMERDHA